MQKSRLLPALQHNNFIFYLWQFFKAKQVYSRAAETLLQNEWQFSRWIITFFFIILGACPSGYTLKPGDVPGWGSISGSHSTTTINDCSALCDKDASCRSFEYSKTEMICNLNREHEPTQGPFRDYLFCTCTSCPTGKNVATHHTLFADSFSQWHI